MLVSVEGSWILKALVCGRGRQISNKTVPEEDRGISVVPVATANQTDFLSGLCAMVLRTECLIVTWIGMWNSAALPSALTERGIAAEWVISKTCCCRRRSNLTRSPSLRLLAAALVGRVLACFEDILSSLRSVHPF